MKAKKVMALMLCAAMVTSMSATAAFAAEEKEDAATEESADSTAAEDPTAQFDGLKANEASLFDILDTKSSRLLKSPPFSRSAMITSTTARPTLLIAERP